MTGWIETLVSVILFSSSSIVQSQPDFNLINVAITSNVTAKYSCGWAGDEIYYNHTEALWSANDRQPKICTMGQFPPHNMVDGLDDTVWQSSSRNLLYSAADLGQDGLDTSITLDLHQAFIVQKMVLNMGDSKRPGRLSISRSYDGQTWTPIVYRVSSGGECSNKFGVFTSSQPLTEDGYICTSYGQPMQNNEETIMIDLTQYALTEWKMAAHLRINFYQLHLTLGIGGDKFQHYTIREVKVMAKCLCNDMATNCVWNNNPRHYDCVCGHNSQGDSCESCLPLYNQQPYRAGVSCEECQCYGHASACSHNDSVALGALSLNIENEYIGGGVCNSCDQFTTGINCESCLVLYHRPLHLLQNDTTPCRPCNCYLAGVVIPPGAIPGDCVRNVETLPVYNIRNESMDPGDCFCKKNVGGAKCASCLPTYYNLSGENPIGCQDCECNAAGTEGNNNICDAVSGNCSCKKYVEGDHCTQCADNHHSLSPGNIDGCDACGCVVGASLSPSCNKSTGQCGCKPFTYGLTCDRLTDGYYYPDVDSIAIEPELFSESFNSDSTGVSFITVSCLTADWWTGEFLFPMYPGNNFLTGLFDIYMKYQSNEQLRAEATLAVMSQVLQTHTPVTECLDSWCYHKLVDQPIEAITGDLVFVSLTINGSLWLNSIVISPHEFTARHEDNTTSLVAPDGCDLLSRSTQNSVTADCERFIYSVSMQYYGTAQSCSCNTTGSQSTVCSTRGGSCTCKDGVGGRACDRCLSGYYNFTSLGCQECRCAGEDKLCDQVTGECQCPLTLQRPLCEKCISNHWNWTYHGCQRCECHPEGSTGPQCDLDTGHCPCLPGVTNSKCDVCQLGYFNLSAAGCTPCGCDEIGSTSDVCDRVTGECTCKDNVKGRACDICSNDSYYFGGDETAGCVSCYCMGVVDTCSSYNSTADQVVFELSSASVASLDSSQHSTDITVNSDGSVTLDQSLLFLRVVSPGQGDWLVYYGSSLEVTYRTSPILLPATTLTIYLQANNSTLIHSTVAVPAGVYPSLPLRILLMEGEWVDTEGALLSRETLLDHLQLISSVYLPLNVGDGSISISDLQLTPSAASSLLVEMCQCGQGYSGLSCQSCAYGYTKHVDSSNRSLDLCTPCSCNEHALTCLESTGECLNCQNHTAGFNCELCQPGYYGGSLTGRSCERCPCSRVGSVSESCSLINNTVSCGSCKEGYRGPLCDECEDFFWWNGTGCAACRCNGNSIACNQSTGECTACGNNSTGWSCDMCLHGYYGNASTQTCAECVCSNWGSISSVCDKKSGQCECRDTVHSLNCDICKPDHWNFSSAGCQPCNCDPTGSVTLQCDLDTGSCTCKENATGYHCDLCSLGSFGLPGQPCQGCECDLVGTTNSSRPCDVTSGQCACVDGVAGRKCDRCLDLYFNFSSSGCTECGECEQKLADISDGYENVTQEYTTLAMRLLTILHRYNELLELGEQAWEIIVLNAGSSRSLQNISVSALLETSELVRLFVDDYSKMAENISIYVNGSNMLEEASQLEFNKLREAHDVSLAVSENLTLLENVTQQLIGYSERLNYLASDSIQVWGGYWTTHNVTLAYELTIASDLLQRAQSLISLISSHHTRSMAIEDDLLNVSVQVEVLLGSCDHMTNAGIRLNASVFSLRTSAVDTLAVLNETQLTFGAAERIYNSTMQFIDQSNSLYDVAWELYSSSLLQVDTLQSSRQQLEANLEMRKLDQEMLSLQLNDSKERLEQLEILAPKFTQAAINVSQLISNMTTGGLDNVYSRYVNTSRYLEELAAMAVKVNSTISSYGQTLSNDSLASITPFLATTLTGVAQLHTRLLSGSQYLDVISEELTNLTQVYERLAEVLESAVGDVMNASAVLAAVGQEVGNDFILMNQVSDKLTCVEEVAGSFGSRPNTLSVTFTSYSNLALLLYNTSQSNTAMGRQLNSSVPELKEELTTLINASDDIGVLEQGHADKIEVLEQRLNALEIRLANAKRWSVDRKKPTEFKGNESDSFNITLRAAATFELSMEISFVTRENQQVLLITSDDNQPRVLLSLTQGSLTLTVYGPEEVVGIESRLYLFAHTWYRVHVASYKGNISLSTTHLDAGSRPVVDTNSLQYQNSVSSLLGNQAKLAIGGDVDLIDNITYKRLLQGCVRKLKVNSHYLDMSRDSCTRSCPSVSRDIYLQSPSLSLNGFGYAYLPISTSNLSFSLSLRTFASNGEVISFLGADNSSYFALSLVNSRISVRSSQGVAETTRNTYNTGDWMYIQCASDGETHVCHVQGQGSADVLTTSAADLQVRNVLLGSTNRQADKFAGCIANLTIDGRVVDAWRDVSEQQGLFPYCHRLVEPGLSLEEKSLVTFTISEESSQTLDIYTEFISYGSAGSIICVSSDNVTLQLGVVPSHLVLAVAVDEAVQQFEFIAEWNDSQFHNLSIALNTSRIIFRLDEGEPVELAVQLSTVEHNEAWLVQIGNCTPPLLPVYGGIAGGIKRLQINQKSVPLPAASTHDFNYLVSLAGIEQPPIYLLDPSLITPAPPTCAPPVDPPYSSVGRRFGDEPTSYAIFSSLNISAQFNFSVAITMRFRARAANGLLFYMADNVDSPQQWMSLSISDGFIHFNMKTSSLTSSTISSNLQYASGMWTLLAVLRYHNFAALVVNGKDYANNMQSMQQVSHLSIGEEVFVGGVSARARQNMSPTIIGESMQGCIDYVTLSAVYNEKTTLNLTSPSFTQGTGLCYSELESGIHVSAEGFIHLASGINVTSLVGFTLDLRLQSRNRDYLILAAIGTDHYLYVYVNDSKLLTTLGHFLNGTQQVISMDSAANLCDLHDDVISLSITDSSVRISVGEISQQEKMTSSLSWQLRNADLYVGGVPGELAGHVTNLNSSSLCLNDIHLNSEEVTMENFISSHHAAKGCF